MHTSTKANNQLKFAFIYFHYRGQKICDLDTIIDPHHFCGVLVSNCRNLSKISNKYVRHSQLSSVFFPNLVQFSLLNPENEAEVFKNFVHSKMQTKDANHQQWQMNIKSEISN